MAEVPDHLVPSDGLTNAKIKFTALFAEGREATVRFTLTDTHEDTIGNVDITVGPSKKGTVDAMIENAHREMVNILRQWLYQADTSRKAYDR